MPQETIIKVNNLTVFAGRKCLLREINLEISHRQVFAILGPSGAGKTTLLRSMNRLAELDSNFRFEGDILFQGTSIFAPGIDLDALRARIGIIFQQPVIFPGSISKNVLFGVSHLRRLSRIESADVAEKALRDAALWNEVKDRLHESAAKLSAGQQQRLCLARTLALEPEVILMDEPTSALDAKSTEAIEDLILKLKSSRTIVLVTHDLAQADRIADEVATLEVRNGAGEIASRSSRRERMLAGK